MYYKLQAFNLIELLVALVIISTITLMAVPLYQDYKIKTNITAMWAEAKAPKLAVESQYIKHNQALTDINYANGAEDFTSSSLAYVSSISVTNGTVTVTGDASYFANKDIELQWIPSDTDNQLTWTCQYSADAAAYVVEHCNAL